MADYLTDDDINDYFSIAVDGFELSTIPTFVRASAYEEINNRCDYVWSPSEGDETVYLDGRGIPDIYVDKVPILSITSMVIIAKDLDETEVNVDQTDSEREVWIDYEIGKISMIRSVPYLEADENTFDSYPVFPLGIRNVKVVGQFGEAGPTNILKVLQLNIIARRMSTLDPSTYGFSDIIQERIGKYEYKLLGYSSSSSKRLSMDEYIEYLFSLLPKHNKFLITDV